MLVLPEADEFSNVTLPPVLQRSLDRHRANLLGMVTALRAAGLSEDAVETHLSILIASYKTELSAALNSMGAVHD